MIDPGPLDDVHLDEVASAANGAGRVTAVLVTHDHPDHAPGAAAFAARVDAPLYAFRMSDAEHLRDGQRIHVGPLDLVACHTPGHTSDHLAFHVPSEGALFTGDAVLGRGEPASSIRRTATWTSTCARWPGCWICALARSTRAMVRWCCGLRPRCRSTWTIAPSARSRCWPRWVRTGRAIPDMVSTIYADYPVEVHELAERSVLAHLLKLEGEGRVEKKGRGKKVTWSTAEPRSCDRCGRPVKGRGRYCNTCSFTLLQEGEGPAATQAESDG